MKRIYQSVGEILTSLSPLEASWRDEFADAVIVKFEKLQPKNNFSREDIEDLLNIDDGIYCDSPASKRFDVGLTAVRLFLDQSKDEFVYHLKTQLGDGGIGIKRWNNDREAFLSAFQHMGLLEAMADTTNRPVTWIDLIAERLKGGRGSAIKGQTRGRGLEDFVDLILEKVFGKGRYVARCRFTGATGRSDEKCDFAIPNAQDPSILIEVKGYGATGSKQTDILGDIRRIIDEKRDDTSFLLFTDGITWKERVSDLKKLVDMQNLGQISRIYTKSMEDSFFEDLTTLKNENEL